MKTPDQLAADVVSAERKLNAIFHRAHTASEYNIAKTHIVMARNAEKDARAKEIASQKINATDA